MAHLRSELAFPALQQAAALRKTFSDGRRETWFLLTSLPPQDLSAQQMLAIARKHWQIENGLHHVKDRTLQEDAEQGRCLALIERLTILRNGVVSIYNRLTPPDQRKQSRPLQAIQIATNPRQCLHELRRL